MPEGMQLLKITTHQLFHYCRLRQCYRLIVGSADVKALYPSLDMDFTVDKVCEVFYGSEVRVEGVNVEELGLYLSVSLKEDDLMEAGIARYCPTRKSNRGRPPSITGSVLEEKKEKRFMSWKPASEQPDEVASRRMRTEALRVVLKYLMGESSHSMTIQP